MKLPFAAGCASKTGAIDRAVGSCGCQALQSLLYMQIVRWWTSKVLVLEDRTWLWYDRVTNQFTS